VTSSELELFLHQHQLTYTELAALLGVSSQAVYQWLQDKRSISLTVSRLLKLFDKYPQLMEGFGR